MSFLLHLEEESQIRLQEEIHSVGVDWCEGHEVLFVVEEVLISVPEGGVEGGLNHRLKSRKVRDDGEFNKRIWLSSIIASSIPLYWTKHAGQLRIIYVRYSLIFFLIVLCRFFLRRACSFESFS